ncbi:MAG: aminotransferase class I/II-fold pyridoxal phosphate-dependent enzyme [Gemmatimonadaceae bacterium]|nr:aminotransferase class I/II-fold pyridoxal phosphate-dependent enzyme [Chitinophagaceae bacterium]
MIDLRSDTVTRPGAQMLEAMKAAAVGDDVFSEDPSVNELEEMAADMFGMQSALYCPTGTMSNQIGIKCHTQPGDEIICEKNSHVYLYEGGGIAFNSGAQVKLIDGDRGQITADQVKNAINPDDLHKARTSLVSLENTANRGGGSCYDFGEIEAIRKICDEQKLALHLDGARLFNAIVAKKESSKTYGRVFDSISICLNKGLGCPIGSILIGERDFIRKARRVRKVFGGGMRQAGFMAATGLFALKNNIERLELDHIHAKQLESALIQKSFTGKILPVETNIVIFEVLAPYSAPGLVEKFKASNIHCIAISTNQIRLVTHLDISEQMIKDVIKCIEAL